MLRAFQIILRLTVLLLMACIGVGAWLTVMYREIKRNKGLEQLGKLTAATDLQHTLAYFDTNRKVSSTASFQDRWDQGNLH